MITQESARLFFCDPPRIAELNYDLFDQHKTKILEKVCWDLTTYLVLVDQSSFVSKVFLKSDGTYDLEWHPIKEFDLDFLKEHILFREF